MALARVVTFDGVSSDGMEQMRQEMEGQDQPEGLSATEILVLHDPDAEQSLVVLFCWPAGQGQSPPSSG